jgi:hypothetical protein
MGRRPAARAHHDGHRFIPDALVVGDDAHALQRHQATVRVRVHDLRAKRQRLFSTRT